MTTNKQMQRFLGGVEQGFKAVTTATGPYTADKSDALTIIDTATGAIGAITLPNTPPVGTAREHTFLTKAQTDINNVTILAPGGGDINGSASVTISVPFFGLTLFTEDGLHYEVSGASVGVVGPSNAVYVDPAGNDATGKRGNFAFPFLTIEAALAVAQNFDEILIAPGHYSPTVPLTPPVGVTALRVRGSGRSDVPVLGTYPGGTVIDDTNIGGSNVFDFVNVMDYLLMQQMTIAAAQFGINLDGTTSAGLFGVHGIFVEGVRSSLQANFVNNMRWSADSEIADACIVNTCSTVVLAAMTVTPGIDVSWDDTAGAKPAAPRDAVYFQGTQVVGAVTIGGQAAIDLDAGSTVQNIQSAGTLSVANGLAPIVRCFGRVTGIIDFISAGRELPDTAVACVFDFDNAELDGTTIGFKVAGAPPTHRQTIDMRNATVDSATITAGSAIDIDVTGITMGTGTGAATAVSGAPVGAFLEPPFTDPFFAYATKTANYTLLVADQYIGADTTAGGFTFTVPQTNLGTKPRIVATIFKRSQDTNYITIARGAFAGKLQGDASDLVLTHSSEGTYPAWDFFFDGTDIWVLRRQTQDPLTQVSQLSPTLQQKLALDLFYGGTFTRSTTGAVQFRAARTDGQPWITVTGVQSGVRRVVDYGDSHGQRVRLEGLGLNLIVHSTDWTNASWVKTGVTAAQYADPSPDEGEVGNSLVYAAAAGNQVTQTFTSGVGAPIIGSVWLRCAAGTQNIRLVVKDNAGTETTQAVTVTTTWTRYSVSTSTPGAGAGPAAFTIRNGADGLARTVFAWSAYVGNQTFRTTDILTDTVAVARQPDLLTYKFGSYPGTFNSVGFQVVFYPESSDAELVAGGFSNSQALVGDSNGTDFIMLSYAGAVASVYVFAAGAFQFIQNVTWTRDSRLVVNINPSTGTLVLSGFTAGNGVFVVAPWVSTYRDMEIGTRSGGVGPMYGEFERYIVGN